MVGSLSIGSSSDRLILVGVISRLITDAGSAGDQGVHLANRLHSHLGCAHAHSNPPSQILRRYVPSDGIEMLVEWGDDCT
jgi:hypothetical protein